MDTWGLSSLGDGSHQDDRPQESSRETAGAAHRFQFATAPARVRRRIPLSSVRSDPVVQLEADLPPPAPPQVADGSSPDLFGTGHDGLAIPVEVRLRRDLAPTADQVDDVVAWLRTRRVRTEGTPPPMPALSPMAAPAVLQPLLQVEPARRAAVWPLVALSLGLAVAAVAAIVL